MAFAQRVSNPSDSRFSQGCIAHHQRCYATFRHKRMIHRQNHNLFIDNVEGMPEFARIPYAGDA